MGFASTLTFEKIPISRDIISQGELNIEKKIRSNLFAWNGQFSPQFVEVLLRNYAKKGDVVIDPFVGSGTTLYEAARKGIAACGTELNASAYYMAKTYELANSTLSSRQNILCVIEHIIFNIASDDMVLPVITQAIKNDASSDISNLLSTLIVLMDFCKNEPSLSLLRKRWAELKQIVLEMPFCTETIRAEIGDARKLNYDTNMATLLVTSPPYINVFNYHQKYRKSVEVLGYNVLDIAKREIGSNRKNRGNRLLTVIQYCIDMTLSMQEAMRVCKDGARMIYVVGRESNVLGYPFCNSKLIFEIATNVLGLPFLLRQERVFKNRFGQLIYEDILHFRNLKDSSSYETSTIEDSARSIATKQLLDIAKIYPESKNIKQVFEAIKKANKVNKSKE